MQKKQSKVKKLLVGRPAYMTQIRDSYTGFPVIMERIGGVWQPFNGRFVACKMDGLTVRVLCHDADKDPTNLVDSPYRNCGTSAPNDSDWVFRQGYTQRVPQ